jgi:site-specific recombinase XerD
MHNNYRSIQQFTQLVEFKDYRPPTKKEYVRMIRRLADHVQCDPATLTEDQVRHYFLYLRQEKKFGRSAMTIAKAASTVRQRPSSLAIHPHCARSAN